MSKINVLDSSIYNKIAAGEVVERPASVVKELIENALDAGAKNISISIDEGGKKQIAISDDGHGIGREDLRKAFYPHATSKITNIDDLYSINTLGFRGEALSSIAAISMVEIKSKTKEDENGFSLIIHGGEEKSFCEAACREGTQMIVSNLFFNTPVREKFLKKNSQEEHEITNLVERYILIKNDISFRYTVNGSLIYQTSGTGLKDAIYVVYGKDTVNNVIDFSNEYKGMKINGYIGKPTFFKSNKSYQTVSLNGRYIINSQVSIAVNNAYADYLMKRTYPFYVFDILIPNDAVDVNVHPNKMDVRFENSSDIFKLVFGGISFALNQFNKKQMREVSESIPTNTVDKQVEKKEYPLPSLVKESVEPVYASKEYASSLREPVTEFSYDVDESRIIDVIETVKTDNNTSSQQTMNIPLSYQLIGQVFSTYVIIESGDKLYFIDQHAAHERFLYDKISLEYGESKEIQSLLVPYVFSVSAIEYDLVASRLSFLGSLGFEISEFGDNTFRIISIPIYFHIDDISDFISDIISDAKQFKKIGDIERIKERLAQKACKSAIKAGKHLSEKEIQLLISAMQKGDVLQCPHGRPVIIPIEKNDIEKWFKRVL